MSMEYDEETKEHSAENEEASEEYSFLQETIKEQPIGGKKLAGKVMRIAVYGIVFGMFASIGFVVLKPWADETFQKDPGMVTVPEDEVDETEDPNGDEAQEPAETPVLDIESYKELNRALFSVANEANKSMAEVTAISGEENWIAENFDQVNSVAGVIAGDNGQDLLILTVSSILKEADSLQVTLADGKDYDASLYTKDENLGLAVLAVPRQQLTDAAWNQIRTITIGNSNAVSRGDTVIALGKPFNYYGGMGYGIISSTRNKLVYADGEYSLLATDLPGTTGGTGILVSVSGELIGIIQQSALEGESTRQTSALAISGIKKDIELLLNGKQVPYVGIMGVDVTEDISKAQNMPRGVYVRGVEADSPAMKAGIQNGDILTDFNKTEVTSLSTYAIILKDVQVGEQIKVKGKRNGADGYVDVEFTIVVGSKE